MMSLSRIEGWNSRRHIAAALLFISLWTARRLAAGRSPSRFRWHPSTLILREWRNRRAALGETIRGSRFAITLRQRSGNLC
jgi:hypothetical protein